MAVQLRSLRALLHMGNRKSLTCSTKTARKWAGLAGLGRITWKALISLLFMTLWIGCAHKDGPIRSKLNAEEVTDKVVLLHGLIRSSISMVGIARRLRSAGYQVFNLDYSARQGTLDQMVEELRGTLQSCCLGGPGRLHFVTHSLGGIIVREYIAKYPPPNLGRVVMLGPPNQGSELADFFGDNPVAGWVFGPVVAELGTGPNSKPNQLGPVEFELGVITGDHSWNPIASWMIPGPDDGTVSVERAKVEGMKRFMVVPHTHTFIMNSDQVIDQVLFFLEHGDFSPAESETLYHLSAP